MIVGAGVAVGALLYAAAPLLIARWGGQDARLAREQSAAMSGYVLESLRGLPENVLGICGTIIVLGRGDGDAFGSVEDPRAVRGLLAGEDPA